MTEFDHASLLRQAAAVKRFHTHRMHGEQTLGTHTFGVLLLIRQLWPNCRKELLYAAIHHDLPELITGDMPAPVKRAVPGLQLIMEQMEATTGVLYYEAELTPLEQALLKWCDVMELVMYCLEQIMMGNFYAREPLRTGLKWLAEVSLVNGDTSSLGIKARNLYTAAATHAKNLGVEL